MLQISVTRFATQAAAEAEPETEPKTEPETEGVCDSPFRFVIRLMTKMDRKAVASLRWGKHLIETFASQCKFASQMDCTVGTIKRKNIDIYLRYSDDIRILILILSVYLLIYPDRGYVHF